MRSARGFSLLEVLVALAVLAVAVWSIAQVSLYTARSSDVARRLTLGSELAADKLGQLRGLTWAFDADGLPVADEQTDLTAYPERPAGGMGLRPSPIDALERNTSGYCDFLDGEGRSLGGGSSPPVDTAYVRRWSVTPLPTSPLMGLVLQVRLLSPEAARWGSADAAGVTLTALKSRLGP